MFLSYVIHQHRNTHNWIFEVSLHSTTQPIKLFVILPSQASIQATTITMRSSTAFLLFFLSQQNADGFSASKMTVKRTDKTLEATSGRRAFLDLSVMTAASAMLVSWPVWAEDDGSVGDLSMPTEEEQKQAVSIVKHQST
jgi:hypothetical protein